MKMVLITSKSSKWHMVQFLIAENDAYYITSSFSDFGSPNSWLKSQYDCREVEIVEKEVR